MGGRAGGGARGGGGAAKPTHSETLAALKEYENAKKSYIRAGKMAAKAGGYKWTAQTQKAYDEGKAKEAKLFASESKAFEKYKAAYQKAAKTLKAFNGQTLEWQNSELFK